MDRKIYKVGIVGAPNVGKTSLFNSLSGSSERVGNWPGTTVERVEKRVKVGGKEIIFVDLPGTYSLSVSSGDEKVAKSSIFVEKFDLVVVVVSAVNFYNSLFLVLELLEMGFNVIVALNMIDVASKDGIKIDIDKLSSILGVRVVPTVGRSRKGVMELLKVLYRVDEILDKGVLKDFRILYPRPIENGIDRIVSVLRGRGVVTSKSLRGIAIKILEEDDFVIESKVMYYNIWQEISEIMKEVRRELRMLSSDDVDTAIVRTKYVFIDKIIKSCVLKTPSKREVIQKKIDYVLTNKVWGLVIFFGMMFGIFNLVFLLGDPLASIIEKGVSSLSGLVSYAGEKFNWNSVFVSFLTDGLISGVGSVLVFLPYISILFLFIGILENSGFLSRSAVVMDKIMTTFGLHGKSFLPMLIGFGCNIPGIMATRILSSFKDRLITILVLPLISCSARLTVFVVVCSAIFDEYKGIVMFSMYLLGLVLAGIFGIIFRKNIAKGEYSLFVMEIPDFRLPSFRVLFSDMLYRSFLFVRKAGTIIAMVVIMVWFLGSVPFGVDYASKDSVLGIIGNVLKPIFIPLGFGDDWRIVVSIFTAILAREAVVGTLGTVYGVSEEGVTQVLPSVFTPLSGISFLIFMQVSMLCIATVVTISSEIGKKWAIFGLGYTLVTAWILSFLIYNFGRILGFQ
ncbi:MAG: ferrous iron transport protein B [Brevinematia bacterium]